MARTLIAACLVVALASFSVACSRGEPTVPRANVDQLPTPTGGEIFGIDDSDSSGEPESAEPGGEGIPGDGAPIDGGGEGFEDTILARAIEANPEVGPLAQRVMDGTATEADEERLNELLSEIFLTGDGGFGGFAPDVSYGEVVAADGGRITIDPPPDEDGIDPAQSDVTIGPETQIFALSSSDAGALSVGDEVEALASRGDDGLIRAELVTVIELDDQGEAGLFGAPPGAEAGEGAFGAAGGEGIPAQGRVTQIDGDLLHIETAQGPLRITLDQDTSYVRIATGTASDLTAGLYAMSLSDPDGVAFMLVVGPEDALERWVPDFELP